MTRLLAVFAWLCVAFPALAGSATLSVSVPRLAVGQGTHATVTVAGVQPSATPMFEPVDGLSVRFVSRTNQIVNSPETGMFQTFRYTYEVTASAPGEYSLGPVPVKVPGETLLAGPIPLVVTERAAAVPDEPLSASARFRSSTPDSGETVWEGSVVVYEVEVTAQQPIRDVGFEFPKFEGLQQLAQPSESTSTVRDPAGDITRIGITTPLVASGTGDRTQAPTRAKINVLIASRGGAWGLPQTRQKVVLTGQAPLTVTPLPPPPPGFTGLVGDFALRSTLGAKSAEVGASVPWTVEIVGDGVVDGFELPIPTLPQARVYRSSDAEQGQMVDGRWMAAKRFNSVLVPTHPGTLALPDLEVVTFSPSRGAYVTLKAVVGQLEVTGTGANVAVQTFGPDGASVSEEPAPVGLVDIYTWGPSVTPPLAPVVPALLLMVALPGLLVLGLDSRDGVKRWWSSRAVRGAVQVRGRGRLRVLPSDPAERQAVWDLALREMLADRVGTPVTELRRDEALRALDPETATLVGDAFRGLDRARFAGGGQADLGLQVARAIDALEAT